MGLGTGIAYRTGYIVMVVWLIYVLYCITHVDAWNGDGRSTIGILIGLAGLVVFPVYFVMVYVLGRLVHALSGKRQGDH